MASSGQAITQYIYAYTIAGSLGKTGDSANMTARLVADGTESTPAGTIAEIDATNLAGWYKVALTGAENTGGAMLLGGKTTTAGVNVVGTPWTNEKLPTAAPGATNGVFIAGSNAATAANITGNLTGNVSGSVGSVTGAVGSVTGNVGGNVTGSVGSVVGGVGGALTALSVTTYAEPTTPPAATDTLLNKLNWALTFFRNKLTNTASQQKLLADDNSTVIGTASTSNDGATTTRGKFTP